MIVSILLPAIQARHGPHRRAARCFDGRRVLRSFTRSPASRWRVSRTATAASNGCRSRLLFWSAATGLFGLTRTFLQMLAARVALGVGESICIPTSHSLLIDYVAAESRPFALGLHSTGAVLGATLSLVLGGYLEMRVGWRHAMSYFALAGCVLAVVMFATLREPARSGAAMNAGASLVPLREVVAHLLSLKSYLFVRSGGMFRHAGRVRPEPVAALVLCAPILAVGLGSGISLRNGGGIGRDPG